MPETKSKGGLREVGRRAGEVVLLKPSQVQIQEGFNARDFSVKENKDHVSELALSIAEVGVQNPITVRMDKGAIFLVSGESRLRATILASEKTGSEILIPAIKEVSKLSEPDRVASLITTNEGKTLTPMEQGNVFARLRAFQWSDSEIARKVGKSTAHVNAMLMLYSAPEKIKKLVTDGKVAAFNAVDVLRHTEDEEAAFEKMQSAVKEAESQGKTKATGKGLETRGRSKKSSETPIFYQRSVVQSLIDTLVEIASNTSLPRSVRASIKDTLDNAGVDYLAWKKELREEQKADKAS